MVSMMPPGKRCFSPLVKRSNPHKASLLRRDAFSVQTPQNPVCRVPAVCSNQILHREPDCIELDSDIDIVSATRQGEISLTRERLQIPSEI
jgi:hypothetical protein